MSRPVLLPGLVALWRGPRTLQLGVDPRRALVLDLPNPTVAGLLELLDGARTEAGVLAAASRRGIGEADARTLLDTLARHDLVVDEQALAPRGFPAPVRARLAAESAALAHRAAASGQPTPAQVLARRAQARVRVSGRSRLGVPIAVAVAVSGIGHVDLALEGTAEPGELLASAAAADPPRSRVAAATKAIAQFAPGTRVAPLTRRDDVTCTVHVGAPPTPASLLALAHRRIAHLAVAVRDGVALVGPFVPPRGSPCLNCIDLHRTDRDPAWPTLAAQLATPDAQPLRTATEACAATTVLAATAYAVDEVIRYVDGEPPRTLAATVELASPGDVRRRTWPVHPSCGCLRAHRSRPGLGISNS